MELNLLALLLVLLTAWAGGFVAARIGYPAVLGELIAGIVLGPGMLGLLDGGEGYQGLRGLAQMGVLLLMLYVGTEIDPRELKRASWGGFVAAIGGFLVPFAMGLAAVLAFGGTGEAGVMVGIAVGVTSLASKSRMLADLKLLDTRIAHVMMAGALIADTLSLLVFSGTLGMARQEGTAASELLLVLLRVALFFGGCVAVGVWVLPRVFAWLRRYRVSNRGVYFTLMLLIALSFAEAAHAVGLHGILGTFVAGLFLRRGMIEPKLDRQLNGLLRDVSVGFLAPIFYVMAGFRASPAVFQTDLALLLTLTAIAFIAKIGGTALFYMITRHGWREGIVIGGGMNARGTVEIVLAGIALELGFIDESIFSILVFIAIITTATAPAFLKWGAAWLERRGELVRATEKRNAVVIIGATALARAVARVLGTSQPVYLIDANASRVREARDEGLNAIQGNALETDRLAEAHAYEASLGLAMTSNVEVNALAARELRETFMVPKLHVLVRGRGRNPDSAAFEHLDATMLFGQAILLNDWEHWFARGAVDIERVPAIGHTAADALQTLDGDGRTLFLAIEREAQGLRQILPFHGGAALEPHDLLVRATARSDSAPARDRFDEIVAGCPILDLQGPLDREAFFRRAAEGLAVVLSDPPDAIYEALLDRERLGSTVLAPGLAVPHVMLPDHDRFALLLARCRPGVLLEDGEAPAHALFVLAGTIDQRNLHLKAVSAIAQIWQSSLFESSWLNAKTPDDLRRLVLDAPRPRIPHAPALAAAAQPEPHEPAP